MDGFELDNRLASDCIVLGKLDLCHLLLMNNSLVPWFILVPESSETEFVDLSAEDQVTLLHEINQLSRFIKVNFNVTKLNIAAIGNIVSQLHIHVIGRHPKDFCWPDTVWGRPEKKAYSEQEIAGIRAAIKELLPG